MFSIEPEPELGKNIPEAGAATKEDGSGTLISVLV